MTPNGTDLFAMLVKLLADQNGVKITYTLEEIERKKPNEQNIELCG